MVAPRFRSRSKRRVYVKMPGGKTKIHYRARKPKVAHCSITGQALHGIPRATPAQLSNMPKSKKRPERPFGGVLSSRAMRRVIIEEARMIDEASE